MIFLHYIGTGINCSFCAFRKNHLIEIGSKRLFTEEPELNTELSAQETNSYLDQFNDEYFEGLDDELDLILSQSTSMSRSTSIKSVCVFERKFSSPKGKDAVQKARENSIPVKTKDATTWAVHVWTSWANARNKRLLSDEKRFNPDLCLLTTEEMKFWLSRFVLEVRKKNGDYYPPNAIYQLIPGLQRHLHGNGHASIKLFDRTAFHDFLTTL